MTWKNGLMVLFMAALAIAIAPFFAPLDSDPKAARLAKTKSILLITAISIDDWSKKEMRAPTSAEGLDVLDLRGKPILDGWGRPLIYRHIDNTAPFQYLLYSRGENGFDENGNGDDIKFGSLPGK